MLFACKAKNIYVTGCTSILNFIGVALLYCISLFSFTHVLLLKYLPAQRNLTVE